MAQSQFLHHRLEDNNSTSHRLRTNFQGWWINHPLTVSLEPSKLSQLWEVLILMTLYVFHINLFCDYILNVAHKNLSYKNLPGCLENKRKNKALLEWYHFISELVTFLFIRQRILVVLSPEQTSCNKQYCRERCIVCKISKFSIFEYTLDILYV